MVKRLHEVQAGQLTDNSVLARQYPGPSPDSLRRSKRRASPRILYFNVGMEAAHQVKERWTASCGEVAPNFEGKHKLRRAACSRIGHSRGGPEGPNPESRQVGSPPMFLDSGFAGLRPRPGMTSR